MAKYRIKEYDYESHKNYKIERKSIFGFWYNPDNIDAYTTGWYDSLEEAKDALWRKLIHIKSKVVFSKNSN